jgi:hypothetical protein
MSDITARVSIPYTDWKRFQDAEKQLKLYQQGGQPAGHGGSRKETTDEAVDEKKAESLEGSGSGASLKLPLVAANEPLPFSSRPVVLFTDDPVSTTQLEPSKLAQDDQEFEPITTVQNVLETALPENLGRSNFWWFLGRP